MEKPFVKYFYHVKSGTFTYVVYDPDTKDAVIIDPVLAFDINSGKTSFEAVKPVIDYITEQRLQLHYVLETHAHADHISAAQCIKDKFGHVKVVIGSGIKKVQATFKSIFNFDEDFSTHGEQFDLLVDEANKFRAGSLTIDVMNTPGHTSDSVTYLIGDAAFVGDTLFYPDLGTARCDFPGGDAGELYDSIQKILALPVHTRLFLCHDYPPENREALPETSAKLHLSDNIHIAAGVDKDEYVKRRVKRDETLDLPEQLIPSIQVNIQAGRFPKPESNGISYLVWPINKLKA